MEVKLSSGYLVDKDFLSRGYDKYIVNPATINLSASTYRRPKKVWKMVRDKGNSYLYRYWKELGFPDVLDESKRDIFFEDEYPIDPSLPLILMPGDNILLSTTQLIQVRNGEMGFIFLRSGPGRAFLEHGHAGLIDPGFGVPEPRPLVLEARNDADWPIIIRRGQLICQLAVIKGPLSGEPYKGKFKNQTGAEPPKGV